MVDMDSFKVDTNRRNDSFHEDEFSLFDENDLLEDCGDLDDSENTKSSHQFDSGEEEKDDDQETNVDQILARDMLALSMDERNKALNDLHGILELHPENPQEMDHLLQEMEKELKKIVSAEHAIPQEDQKTLAYVTAERISHDYVHNASFRTMFLRADQYNATNAANRLIEFFEMKKTLFGLQKLCQDIKLQDLMEDESDRICVESGFVQRSPYRDASGRPIVTAYLELRPHSVTASLSSARWNFYVFMDVVAYDEDAQRRGVVWLILGATSTTPSGGHRVREALPVKFGAIHATFYDQDPPSSHTKQNGLTVKQDSEGSALGKSNCSQDITTNEMCSGGNGSVDGAVTWSKQIKVTVHPDKRVRFRRHYGSENEILKALATFGIPHQAVHRFVPKERHLEWLKRQMQMEQKQYGTPPNTNNGKSALSWHSASPENMMMGINTMIAQPSQSFVTLSARKPMSLPWPAQCSQEALSPQQCPLAQPERAPKEQQPQQDQSIDNPLPDDILFGHSKMITDNPGNVRFRQLVDLNMEVYYLSTTNRLTKAEIAKRIVRTLTQGSGRFLRKISLSDPSAVQGNQEANVEQWVEVDDSEAQAKVAHQFRNRRRALLAATSLSKKKKK